MARGRPKKDPFEDLDETFKSAVQDGTNEEIRAKITDAALFRVQTEETRKDDDELQARKEAYHEADAPYKADLKLAKLKIEFCREVLKSRGKNV